MLFLTCQFDLYGDPARFLYLQAVVVFVVLLPLFSVKCTAFLIFLLEAINNFLRFCLQLCQLSKIDS